MLKIIKKKREKLFKMLHVFTMTAMILNMSMVGVFFTGAENALACSGSVMVDKVTVPSGSSQEFSFVAKFDNTADQNFNLNDTSPMQILNFSSAGTYVISEVPVSGWELQSIVCSAENSDSQNFTYVNDLPNAKTTLTIAHDTNITCVFTNKQVPTNICGDGLRNQDSEQCDDGNLVSDDGCSSTCQIELYDFGDAIDFYHTLKTSNGASHKLGSGLFLGASVGDELTGQPSEDADGDDDNTNIDDEDGVIFTSLLERGFIATAKVNATATGKLSAWIDFNRDNDWSDAGEKSLTM